MVEIHIDMIMGSSPSHQTEENMLLRFQGCWKCSEVKLWLVLFCNCRRTLSYAGMVEIHCDTIMGSSPSRQAEENVLFCFSGLLEVLRSITMTGTLFCKDGRTFSYAGMVEIHIGMIMGSSSSHQAEENVLFCFSGVLEVLRSIDISARKEGLSPMQEWRKFTVTW